VLARLRGIASMRSASLARRRLGEQPFESALAGFKRLRPEVFTVEFKRIGGVEEGSWSCWRECGLRFNEHLDGDGPVIFTHARRLGAEGIVSKRLDRPYRSGRSHSWLKIKNPASPAVHRIEEGTW
jgi:hypothetical protein